MWVLVRLCGVWVLAPKHLSAPVQHNMVANTLCLGPRSPRHAQALQNWWLSVWSEATADAEAREQAVRTSY